MALALKKNDLTKRVGLIDEVRGFAILCMVIYHAAYDVDSILGISLPLFFNPVMDVVRDIFAGLFIFISGVACRYSKNNLKRGALCFGLGMVMTLATYFIMPSQLILFGILHMLGISMMLFGLLQKILDKISPLVGIIICTLLFIITLPIDSGAIGISGLITFDLPLSLYETNFLFPLGFYNATFFSSDYFPLLPWLFVFLGGSYVGVYLKQGKFPAFFYKTHSKLLAFIGRNTLIIYVLHQPVIFAIVTLISFII